MDQGSRTGAGGSPLPFARMALIVAAMIAIVAIGLSIRRHRAPPPAIAGPAPAQDMATVVAGLEARLKAGPGDADGWRLLGLAYFQMERFADAGRAYERAVALKPRDAVLWSALGEARVLATRSGNVDDAAAAAFARALAIDPQDPRARYFTGVRKNQGGDPRAAVADWIALLKDSPAGAPWERSVRAVTVQVAQANHIDLTGRLPAATGPSPEQVAAIAALPPAQQREMVRRMVGTLADRLQRSPADPEGWTQLIRARMVLDDPAGAAQALARGAGRQTRPPRRP